MNFWSQFEKGFTCLAPMEGVAIYRVENGEAQVLTEELTTSGRIVELDAAQVAIVKDTGYRHLTFELTPDGNTESVQTDGEEEYEV